MKRLAVFIVIIFFIISLISGCQTSSKKSDHYKNDDSYYDKDDQLDKIDDDDFKDTKNKDRDDDYKDDTVDKKDDDQIDDYNDKKTSSATLKLVSANIKQGSTLDIKEWFTVSISYKINNFSKDKKYRLYLVGRNSSGSDNLYMYSKYLVYAKGSVDLFARLSKGHLRGFGERGDKIKIFVKLDKMPKDKWLGETIAKIGLNYVRGFEKPVKPVLEHLRRNLTINLRGTRATFRRGKKIVWHANGKLKHGYLHRKAVFNVGGIRVTAGVGLANFTKDGRLKTVWNLYRNTLLKAGGRKMLFRRGSSLDFYSDGSVSVGDIARAYTIKCGSKSYKFYSGARIGFFMNGNLRIAKIVRAKRFQIGKTTHRLPSYTLIYFTPEGLIDNLVGARNLSFKAGKRNILCFPGTALTFYPQGTLKTCRLARNTRFKLKCGTVTAPYRSEIIFNPDGSVQACGLKTDTYLRVGGKRILFKKRRSVMRFYKNGGVYMAYPARNFKYPIKGGSILVKAGKQIAFSKNERLIWATPARTFNVNYDIGTIRLKFGRTTHFHKNGIIKMGYLAGNARVTVNDVDYVFQRNKFIAFHSNGIPSRANLAQSKMVIMNWRGTMRNIKMRRGSTIWFNKRGIPKR